MKIKVCGMRYPTNIKDLLSKLDIYPDYLGFIFYAKSPRFVDEDDQELIEMMPTITIKKVGVFVNPTLNYVHSMVRNFNLNVVQLHGNESVEFCQQVKDLNVKVIKAFSIEGNQDFATTTAYQSSCDLFLFDTKTPAYGGSGKKFDWQILNAYQSNTPFLLSGGVELSDIEVIKLINHPNMIGVDINSKFEVTPAKKDIEKIKLFINQLKY